MTLKVLLLTGAASIGLAAAGLAAPIAPHYTTFGTLDGATFGGSGIPNTAVAITTIATGGDTITLGLTATQRYSNPAVTNDGHGTFFAMPGVNSGTALWNFDYYINLTEGMGTNLYSFALVIQDNTTGLFSTIPFPPTTMSGTVQDSENLSFAFYGVPILFNANANDQYAFQLLAYQGDGLTRLLLNTSSINVNVGNPIGVPDSGATVAMLGLGLLGIAGLSLRKRFAQV